MIKSDIVHSALIIHTNFSSLIVILRKLIDDWFSDSEWLRESMIVGSKVFIDRDTVKNGFV